MTTNSPISLRPNENPLPNLAADAPAAPGSGGASEREDLVRIVPSQETDPGVSAYQELDTFLDPETKALWCFMRPLRAPSITPTILYDFLDLHAKIMSGTLLKAHGINTPLEYYIQGSRIPGIYNLGGDLAFMIECIRLGDHEALRRYAHNCVQVVYNIFTGFSRNLVSIAVIEGDSLGGGFEAALCCNYIIAERRARFGFPEILFNCFPGMGAYSFLARRVGPRLAEEMMQNGKIYSAEEMHEMGIVNQLADDGCGKQAVADFVKADLPTYAMRDAMCRIRQCIDPVKLDELRDITDMWVETTLRLSPSDISKMQRFVSAQRRRLDNAAT
jgi:DSF synthase